MNKKGFTVVEVLAVFIILGVLFSLVFPTVNNILRKSNSTVSNVQIDKILDAAYDYTLKNIKFLPDKDETVFLTLNELKKEGLIESDIKDVSINEEYPNDLVISIKNVGNNYKDTDEYSKTNGSYLYTVEKKLMKSSDYQEKKPTITLEGYDSASLVSQININSSFEEPEYSATSYDDKDLTDKVIKNIIYKSNNTNKIDTKKAGIYYINYTVVDELGYSNGVVLSVIVTDNELPELTIPDNVTLSTSATSYDLEDGVKCTDNSGVCDIEINGSIKFGVADKYIIEYIARDPSGNTATDKRVITVE